MRIDVCSMVVLFVFLSLMNVQGWVLEGVWKRRPTKVGDVKTEAM